MYIRRFFAFVIASFLIFSPVYSYATTSIGGWTATDSLIAGANTTINATKTVGGKVLNSAVTVGASASKVGKYLIKGGGQAALAYAMVELLDEGIDWVLDPANNAIKYKDDSGVIGGEGAPVGKYLYAPGHAQDDKYDTPEGACLTGYLKFYIDLGYKDARIESFDPVSMRCLVFREGIVVSQSIVQLNNPAYKPDTGTGTGSGSDGYKYIPIETVAAKVIANAEAGHAPSQEAVKATALEGFAAGEHDAALDAAAVPDTGVENPPDVENPPVDPSLPFDPSSIIAAINSLKALLAGILSAVTDMGSSVGDFFAWTKEESPEELAPVPVPYGDLSDVGLDSVDRYEQRITFNAQCPSSQFSFDMFGRTYYKDIPWSGLCEFLGLIAPWLLAMTYLGTAYFVVENL